MEISSVQETAQPTLTNELSLDAEAPSASAAASAQNAATSANALESSSIAQTITDVFTRLFFGNKPQQPTLSASVDESGRAVVKTADNYSIRFEGERQEWAIFSPEGQKTTIWGDPHVVESDGDKWDFYAGSTFKFGDNVVEVETTPSPYDGKTYSKRVKIINGSDVFEITNLDINKPKLVAWTMHKSLLSSRYEAETYQLTQDSDGSDSWVKL